MSIIANNLLQGDEGYNISRSLRFRSSASAYLNRTPATATNRKTWTWSAWVKRGTQTEQMMFGCGVSGSDDATYTYISFGGTNADQLYVNGYTQTWRKTTQLFRDFSAWYHIVVAIDTTQATADNRIKMYVNGLQITSFATANNPSQNSDLSVNRNAAHSISGRVPYGSDSYFDGYMAEVNFIDGQQLTPSSFGETDPITGVWKAKKYGGTYGTNGFYLPFSDNTSTTTLGYDKSGNSNNWTTNNISLTAGTTYDSMVDVPTMSALGSNYAVLNPLWKDSGVTIKDGNLDVSGGNYGGISTFIAPTGYKFYAEYTVTATEGNQYIGITKANANGQSLANFDINNSNGCGYYSANGNKSVFGVTNTAYGSSWGTVGDVIGVALDLVNNTVTFYKNNTSQGAITITASTDYFFTVSNATSTGGVAANFGQRPFSYTPPTGFVALNTFNLPEPSIKAGNAHFDATTYSGTGSSQNIVNSGGFQPSLVWLKTRNVGYGHALFDAVRGVGNGLQSNSTNAEAAWGTSTLASFNSNGFGLGADTSYLIANSSGNTFVGWQWKANGTGSSNTAGSITSTVSANPTAGFSVVTYTGNATNGATVGHGLGVSPSMIITKVRSTTSDWYVWQTAMGDNFMRLNTTAAQVASTGNGVYNTGSFSSSVFALGNGAINGSGATHVAYCFAEVAGYSKFGSYTGNGSTDGTFVHLGFRPKFLMVKCSSNSSTNWFILDTSRDTYNLSGQSLMPNLSNAEYTPASSGYFGDILSNGFKWRDASNNANNASGYTYIYMAFAENPFKYSLAR